MKKIFYGVVLTAVAVVLTGCGFFGGADTVTIDPAQLVGRWEAPSQAVSAKETDKLVFVFQADSCIVDETAYGCWGYQFDEGDDVLEADVLDRSEDGAYHKNGWFGWQVRGAAIRLWSRATVGSSMSLVTNAVSKFSSTEMTMTDNHKTYTFHKVQ